MATASVRLQTNHYERIKKKHKKFLECEKKNIIHPSDIKFQKFQTLFIRLNSGRLNRINRIDEFETVIRYNAHNDIID